MSEGFCECRKISHEGKLVAVTGGPGAGKTALLELVQRDFCRHVTVLPEAASILFSGGFPRRDSEHARRAVQRAIFYTTRELERLALGEPQAAVILCDRGTIDGLAYWPGDPLGYLREVGTTLEEELARYAAVIHLRTPDVDHGYNNRNPNRTENVTEALALDAQIAEAWSGHPQRYFVDTTDGFLEKVVKAVSLINEQVPACCRRNWLFQLGDDSGENLPEQEGRS